MKMIVAVDNRWGTGHNGKLLFRAKEDMKFFKLTTTNQVVIMGRKTFDSLPNGPLPNRINIVITKDKFFDRKDVRIAHSIEEAVEISREYPDKEVFCIGGGQIYEQMLPYCDTAYVTRFNTIVIGTDTFCPNLDKHPDWHISKIGKLHWEPSQNLKFQLYIYKKTVKNS